MATSGRQRIWILAALNLCLLVPGTLAFRMGAFPGASGGLVQDGTSCTECHAFHEGAGGVELSGVPRRYRPGATYQLTLRVFDPDQVGAGFQVSAEGLMNGLPAHIGTMLVTDATETQGAQYVTHTTTGANQSVANWSDFGNSYTYSFAWQAPVANAGPVTFFAAGKAINNDTTPEGDHFYFDYATAPLALPGDADGDGDRDLRDFAVMQRCFDPLSSISDPDCFFIDIDRNGQITLADLRFFLTVFGGPTALNPPEYALADAVRGGALYDNWWVVNGAPLPTGDHPLYPELGQQSGPVTFRCKECHGWDYKGVDGVYGAGSRYTGIIGVENPSRTPLEVFELLKADPAVTPGGHNMTAYGMSDDDLWDVIKMVFESVVDTDLYIQPNGTFIGDAGQGSLRYGTACFSCHGDQGMAINFGTPENPEYVGTVANVNPWEFLHKVRFGHPGTPMTMTDLLRWPVSTAADIGLHSQSMP